MKNYYSIGEVAERTGINAYTLRYYDKEGLLSFVKRSPSGVRQFAAEDFEPLYSITVLKRSGMPIKEIRKFMEYYMPTTLKLVHTYREFEDQKLEGDNITRTKKDIEDTLDMINVAFENLLNDLFKDAAVEASADISVLNALFAQEGLKEKEFEVIPRK